MMGFGFGMGFLGLILMILFWGALIALAVWLVGLLFPATKRPDASRSAELTSKPPLTAREILKARYAQGELSDEQYQRMLQTVQE
jgi:putative membrane protein